MNANQSTYCATEYYHVLIITKEVLKHEMEFNLKLVFEFVFVNQVNSTRVKKQLETCCDY